MMRSAALWFARLAARRWLSILIPGALIVLLRLAILPWNPAPDPMAPDEFSQLLAAKMFASGHVSYPTPPHWQHFETPYVLMEPAYASKYPPGPPALMALGLAVAGSAWAGVLLGAALMCGGFAWMLQAWVPRSWALAGAILAVARYSIHHYWLNSYWGGCLAAFGGALVIGALPRILRGGRTQPALVMALGLIVLAVTRPYEGLLLSIVPGVVLLLWVVRAPRQRLTAVFAPMSALLVIAGSGYAFYNWKVTGSPLQMPYTAYTARYEPAPHFIWQSRHSVPPFLHREMEAYLTFPGLVEKQRTFRAAAWRALEVIGIPHPFNVRDLRHPKVAANVLFGVALLISAAVTIGSRSMRVPLLMLAVFVAGLIPETFFFDHYAAPAAGLTLLVIVQGLRRAAVSACWRRGIGRGLPVMLSFGALAAVLAYVVLLLPFATHPPQYITIDRPRVIAHVSRFSGKHLLLVRFGPSYTIDDGEWIYNEPDLEDAQVVWARDMGPELNGDLLRDFRDRQVWYVYKDRGPARIYRADEVAADPSLGIASTGLVTPLR